VINWQRIVNLRINFIAGSLSWQWQEDFDEIHSRMVLAIAERAAKVSDFLDQTDGYVRTWGKWAVQRQYRRREQRHRLATYRYVRLVETHGEELECLTHDGYMPTAAQLSAADAIQAVLEHPNEELRAVMKILLSNPDAFIRRRDGHVVINQNALGIAMGRSRNWVGPRLQGIREALVADC
jgi:hypothetical protein